jgi:phosphatidate cytidylyltransferase
MLAAVPPVMWALGGALVALWFATMIVHGLARMRAGRDYTELKLRVRTWWWILGVFALAVLFHPLVGVVVFAFVSFLAFKEYLSLVPTRRADHRVLFWAYYAIPVHYFWIGMQWYGMFVIFIPIYMFLLLPMRMVLIGDTQGFLRAAATLHWGLMTTVFSLSHMAYLLVLPASGNPAGGGAALLFYLVFLTQFNDVLQYLSGKLFGRTKVTPTVSPNKTLEGVLGGVIVTTALAVLLAPYLTPLTLPHAVCAGLLISLFGFIGDVSVSAVKRDLGVKDSGTMLPGHGGILDRLDSLTYTAPLFFHFVYYLYY